MGKTVALRKEEEILRHELTPKELVSQTQKVIEIKEKVMREKIHYGTIPGCGKPSLLKPGAEKLCQAFRLKPEFETTFREDVNRTISWEKWDYKGKKEVKGTTEGFIDYDSACTLVHIPTGEVWAKKVGGSCNNFETRYRSLSPYDVKNTLEKMAEKRALVAAVLIGTALSDVFTQDLEDLPALAGEDDREQSAPFKPKPRPPANQEPQPNGVRLATPKQVAYIKGQLRKQGISQKDFFSVWIEEFDSFDNIPFHKVNDILKWIREF
jgi:hypothetical protein